MKSIKVVVVGDGAVGKTALLVRFCENLFSTDYTPTTWDSFAKNIQIEGEMVGLRLCDTPGQDDFERMRPMLYNETNVFILCFSIHSRVSYENSHSKWLGEIRHHCPSVPIILVGTKKDLRDIKYLEEPLLTPAEGESLKVQIDANEYLECSAQSGDGVIQIFNTAALSVLKPKTKPKPKGKRKCSIL